MIRPTCLATKWYHPRTPHQGCPHFGHQVCDQIDTGLDSGQLTQITMIAYNLDKFMAASLSPAPSSNTARGMRESSAVTSADAAAIRAISVQDIAPTNVDAYHLLAGN